jgi:hypothetical protein
MVAGPLATWIRDCRTHCGVCMSAANGKRNVSQWLGSLIRHAISTSSTIFVRSYLALAADSAAGCGKVNVVLVDCNRYNLLLMLPMSLYLSLAGR